MNRIGSISTITTLSAVGLLMSAFTYASNDHAQLKGYWAMKPLKNGIANVVSFDGKDKSTVYPFKCDTNGSQIASDEKPETSNYVLNGDQIQLTYINNQDLKQEFSIIKLEKNQLILKQELTPSFSFSFEYERVKDVKPLCTK